jgi:hypothetical protein
MLTARHRIATAALAVTAVALLPHVPAGAAMPKSKPTIKKSCPNNPKKTLKIWASKAPFAVYNPCSDWFVMWHKSPEGSDSTTVGVNVAGYSKVNLPINMKGRSWGWKLSPTAPFCDQPESGTTAYYGDGHKLNLRDSGLGCKWDF